MEVSPRGRFEVVEGPDEVVLTFTDRLLVQSEIVTRVVEDLRELAGVFGKQKVVLDFKNVEDSASPLLGALITFEKQVRTAGGELTLCNLNADFLELFKITRLNNLFRIRPNS